MTPLATAAAPQAMDRLLAASGVGPLDTTTLTRALYSTDASLYRIPPVGVAHPEDADELAAVVDAARRAKLPLTMRGAGTSCAGNAVGPGVVVDVGRHLRRIHAIDEAERIAVVDPGVVQDVLSREAQRVGLRYGPDPSTANRCTVGGMIGNNACGPRALGYGRASDNVVALDVITGTGERLTLDSRADLRASASPTLTALQELVMANLGTIRTQFGTFGRQVSGYSLEWLLPERGFDVARFLAGTEGTLAVVTRATVRLVADDPHKVMIALGYPTMPDAADAMPAILPFSPTAVEGMDARIVDVVRRTLGPSAVPELPRGEGWTFVELTDTDADRLAERARSLLASSGSVDGAVVDDPAIASALWKIRSDGAGLAGVSLSRPAYAGWEDAAVPPARLGDYLRDFDALLSAHGLEGLPYGHFGDGCVHCRIDFPLTQQADGARAYRRFVEEAAGLAASYGGSMSGEHGDGRARSELLTRMYSPEALGLFGAVKAIFDPDNLLNPGVLVDPDPLDGRLRAPAVRQSPLFLSHRRFVDDVHRCTGVGKCVAHTTTGVMCPSYQATREEKDSTRGRARVLQEMINGTLVTDGWRSEEVREALELCLSCKGCARDCPTGTDMAAYKARVQYEAYKRRVRPRDHYTMGWLPRWGRLVSSTRLLPPVMNVLMHTPGVAALLKLTAGIDQRRGLPRFAALSNRAVVAAALARGDEPAEALASAPVRRARRRAGRIAGVSRSRIAALVGRLAPRRATQGPTTTAEERAPATPTMAEERTPATPTTAEERAPSAGALRSPRGTSGRLEGSVSKPDATTAGAHPDLGAGAPEPTLVTDPRSTPAEDVAPVPVPGGADTEARPDAAASKPVVLWVDSFSDAFAGDHVAATAAVLIEAGYAPRLLERKACCGLTWITTGQLDGAVRELRQATDVLHPFVAEGIPIVGTEPSCLAVWRSDALELLAGDPRVAEVARQTFTLAEFLARDDDFRMPDLTGHTIVAQPHCHEASVMGWAEEAALLARSGASVVRVAGCCGLAGNHGMIDGHYDFSVAVFGTNLAPALDAAGPDAVVLADGFSCRTQLTDLRGRSSLTFAELLLAHPSPGDVSAGRRAGTVRS